MTAKKPWEVFREQRDIHVLPVRDKREHELSHTCPCEPKVDVEGACLVIVHNARDHREIIEEAEEIIKGKE